MNGPITGNQSKFRVARTGNIDFKPPSRFMIALAPSIGRTSYLCGVMLRRQDSFLQRASKISSTKGKGKDGDTSVFMLRVSRVHTEGLLELACSCGGSLKTSVFMRRVS